VSYRRALVLPATIERGVLVTGGLGYLGSHTACQLISQGYNVTILDSLVNSETSVLDRIESIAGKRPRFIYGDVRDSRLVEQTINEHQLSSVVHFAGLKAVGESSDCPLDYYENNVQGMLAVLRAMQNTGVYRLVFSSSATVYGEPCSLPIDENHPIAPTNPYGRTKRMIEQILSDVYNTAPRIWSIFVLRYFNPAGAHESGLLGERPKGTPNNLFPYLAQVATRERPFLSIFGDDYPTPDGTAIRDYIHVMDLTDAHVASIERMTPGEFAVLNLGTGLGYSVMDIVRAFERACRRPISYEFAARRIGDVCAMYSDPNAAHKRLDWRAKRDLEAMVESAWQFYTNDHQVPCTPSVQREGTTQR